MPDTARNDNPDPEWDGNSFLAQREHPERVNQSWQSCDRRWTLSCLARGYDWYVDAVFAWLFAGAGMRKSDEYMYKREVKASFFSPNTDEMNSKTRRFWLAGWEKDCGPVRWFFLARLRGFMEERRRYGPAWAGFPPGESSEGDVAMADEETAVIVGGPGAAVQAAGIDLVAAARFDRRIFLKQAMAEYKWECLDGDCEDHWIAYRHYISSWPMAGRKEVADLLMASEYEVNNHIYQGQTRLPEIVWLLIRGMEIDDTVTDQSMLALFGSLPACRAREDVPDWD